MKSTTTLTLCKVQVDVRWRDRGAKGRRLEADGACPNCKRYMPAGTYAVKVGGRWACIGCADAPSAAEARRKANQRLSDRITGYAQTYEAAETLCWLVPAFDYPFGCNCTGCGERADKRYARVGTDDVTRGRRLCVLCMERQVRIDARNALSGRIRRNAKANQGAF